MTESKTSPIRCVIYDCDGVLFDSLEANRRFYSRFCAPLGRPPLTDEELEYAHTHTVHQAIRHLLRAHPGLISRALELLSQADPEDSIQYLKPEPNLLPALRALKERGVLRAISTNRSTTMEAILRKFALGPLFDLVVTAGDVANPKPHPESIEKILRALALRKEEALFLGDSQIDQQAARAAGVTFLAYKNPAIPADAHLEDHLAILDFL